MAKPLEIKNPILVGDYVLTGFVRSGSFGQVYIGHSKHDPSTQLAVKSLPANGPKQNEAAVKAEVKIMRDLDHPHIVKFLDAVFGKEDIHIVMEYCNGSDLAAYISQPVQKLSAETTSLFFGQLQSALEYLHHADIIHRDLKPQNVLLQVNSGERVDCVRPQDIILKIADFGFARILEQENMAKTHCGTPIYMAPEVLRGGGAQYDGRCDLWSMGVMMYQCYYGETPFKAGTIANLNAQFQGKTEAVFTSFIPRDLKDLLSRTLKKKPADRISFADFFAHPFFEPANAVRAPDTWSLRGAQKPPSSSVAIPRSAPRDVSPQVSSHGRSRAAPSSGHAIAAQGSYHSPANRHSVCSSHASSAGGYSGHGSSLDEKRFHPSSVDPPSLMPLMSLMPLQDSHPSLMERSIDCDFVMVTREDKEEATRCSNPSSVGQSPPQHGGSGSGFAGYWQQNRRASPQAVAAGSSAGSSASNNSSSLPRTNRRGDTVAFSHARVVPRRSLEQPNRYGSSPAKQIQQQQQQQHAAAASSGSSGGARPSPYLARRNSRASSGSVGDSGGFPPSSAYRHASAAASGSGGGASNSPDAFPPLSYNSPSRYSYVSPWRASRVQVAISGDDRSWSDEQDPLGSCRELAIKLETALRHSYSAMAMIDSRAKVLNTMGIASSEPSAIMSVANRLVEVFSLHKKLAIYTSHFLEQVKMEGSVTERLPLHVVAVARELYPIYLRSLSRSDELLALILSHPGIQTDKASPEQDIFVYMLEKLRTAFSEAKFLGHISKERLSKDFQEIVLLAGYLLDSYNVDNVRPVVTKDMMLYQSSIEQMRTSALKYEKELLK